MPLLKNLLWFHFPLGYKWEVVSCSTSTYHTTPGNTYFQATTTFVWSAVHPDTCPITEMPTSLGESLHKNRKPASSDIAICYFCFCCFSYTFDTPPKYSLTTTEIKHVQRAFVIQVPGTTTSQAGILSRMFKIFK